jgi:hypothetical protein
VSGSKNATDYSTSDGTDRSIKNHIFITLLYDIFKSHLSTMYFYDQSAHLIEHSTEVCSHFGMLPECHI